MRFCMSFFAGLLMGIYVCQTSQIIFYFDDQKFIIITYQ